MNKLRIILLDRNTGTSISNVVVNFNVYLGVWYQDSDHPEGERRTECRQLGVLASNHVGYLSLPIPESINNAGEILYFEASTAAGYTSNSIRIKENQLDVVHSFIINKENIQHPVLNPNLPSVPQPDMLDWKLSPGSFGTSDMPIIGEGGCETLLPSNVTDRVFNFSQLIKRPELESLVFSTPGEFDVSRIAVKRGSLLNYEMSWIPINHGLGQVLYSLTLAPCESVNIAVIDWVRQDTTQRDESTANSESLLHEQRRDRTIDESVEAMVDEFQKGKSLLGGTAGVGGGGISGIFSVTGSHAIGIGRSQSEGERNTEASTIQNLSDRIAQASDALREVKSTVVVQANQAERERIETRAIRNHNHSHALTILYYEVVRHYCVATKLATKQDAYFIDYSDIFIDEFTYEIIYNKQLILKDNLLDENLINCFDVINSYVCSQRSSDLDVIDSVGNFFDIYEIEATFITKNESGAGTDSAPFINLILNSGAEVRVAQVGDSDESNRYFFGNIDEEDFERGDTNIFLLRPETVVSLSDLDRFVIGLGESSGLNPDWTIETIILNALDRNGNSFEIFNREINITLNPSSSERFATKREDPQPEELSVFDQLNQDEKCCLFRLVDHINSNNHFYNKVLWVYEDPDARAVRLDQYFNDGLSLLDSIDNYIIGISGNYVAFPAGKLEVHVPSANNPIYPVERILSLPTRGAFAEAKLSHCNASEKIDETRFWNWQESPCPDDAPQISNISPGSRYQSASGITPTPPLNTLGIENTPDAPDPTGLSDIIDLLKTSDIFRDMSGSEELGSLLQKLTEAAGEVEDRRLQENGATEREKIKAEAKAKEQDSSNGGGSSGNSSSGMSGSSSGTSSSGSNTGGNSNLGGAGNSGSSARETLGESQVLRDILNRGVDEGWMSEGEAGENYRQYAQNLHSSGGEETATDATATSGTRYLPTRSGATLEQGRLLLSDFPVNGWELTEDHINGLNEFARLLNNSATYELLLIEGRASNTGPESEIDVPSGGDGPGNIELSRLRANGVAQYLLGRDIITSGNYPPITAHGSSNPLILADGEVDVNRSVMISYTYAAELPVPDRVPVPTIPDPIVSNRWALALNFSGGAGFVLTGWIASGELKNLETGDTYQVRFAVMGVGVGLASPGGASIDDDDFVSFETYERIPAISFHKRYCRVSNVSAGVAVIGGGVNFIHIPELTNEEITVYGLSMGAVGADIGVGLGGVIWLQESSAERARAELRGYNARVEEYNRSIEGR